VSIDRTIDQLEQMGYFGQLDENLGQRMANGWNNMLSKSFGNNRAAGKLEVGQLVVGLEQDYKKWLGANGISNPTRGDFNRYLGVVQQTHGITFGANGVQRNAAAPAQAAPAAGAAPAQPAAPAAPAQGGAAPTAPAAPAQPAAPASAPVELTAANPTVTLSPNSPAAPAAAAAPAQPAAPATPPQSTGPMPQPLMLSLKAFKSQIVSSGSSQNGIETEAKHIMDYAVRAKFQVAAAAELRKMAQESGNARSAQWVNAVVDSYNIRTESKNIRKRPLKEAADMNEPFSMQDARRWFQTIARHSYNNSTGGGNPAAAGGGSASGGQGAPVDGDAPQETQRQAASGSKVHVTVDTLLIDRAARQASFDYEALQSFVQSNIGLDPLAAGREMNGKFHLTSTNVFAALFVYVRAIEAGK
jgi:hypothetical protein